MVTERPACAPPSLANRDEGRDGDGRRADEYRARYLDDRSDHGPTGWALSSRTWTLPTFQTRIESDKKWCRHPGARLSQSAAVRDATSTGDRGRPLPGMSHCSRVHRRGAPRLTVANPLPMQQGAIRLHCAWSRRRKAIRHLCVPGTDGRRLYCRTYGAGTPGLDPHSCCTAVSVR